MGRHGWRALTRLGVVLIVSGRLCLAWAQCSRRLHHLPEPSATATSVPAYEEEAPPHSRAMPLLIVIGLVMVPLTVAYLCHIFQVCGSPQRHRMNAAHSEESSMEGRSSDEAWHIRNHSNSFGFSLRSFTAQKDSYLRGTSNLSRYPERISWSSPRQEVNTRGSWRFPFSKQEASTRSSWRSPFSKQWTSPVPPLVAPSSDLRFVMIKTPEPEPQPQPEVLLRCSPPSSFTPAEAKLLDHQCHPLVGLGRIDLQVVPDGRTHSVSNVVLSPATSATNNSFFYANSPRSSLSLPSPCIGGVPMLSALGPDSPIPMLGDEGDISAEEEEEKGGADSTEHSIIVGDMATSSMWSFSSSASQTRMSGGCNQSGTDSIIDTSIRRCSSESGVTWFPQGERATESRASEVTCSFLEPPMAVLRRSSSLQDFRHDPHREDSPMAITRSSEYSL